MTRRNQHVTPHSDGWAVKPEGGQKPSSVHRTQREAVDRAREIAQKQRTELFIHDRKGRIRERDSYGHDPFPPPG